MSLRDLVVKEYQATVRNAPGFPEEFKKALDVNNRVPGFMDNICRELSVPAFKNHSNNDLKEIVKNATLFFLNLTMQKAQERMMSEIEKMSIRRDIDDAAILNKACDTGIIDEEVADVLIRKSEKETNRET